MVVSGLLLTVGLVPIIFVFLYYARALKLGAGVVYYLLLLVSGGYVTGLWALLMCVVAGVFVSAMAIARVKRPRRSSAPNIRTRGPKSYAGPGSLGGTDSALR